MIAKLDAWQRWAKRRELLQEATRRLTPRPGLIGRAAITGTTDYDAVDAMRLMLSAMIVELEGQREPRADDRAAQAKKALMEFVP